MDENALDARLLKIFRNGLRSEYNDSIVLTDWGHTRQVAIQRDSTDGLSTPKALEETTGQCSRYARKEETSSLALMDLDLLIDCLLAMREAGWQSIAIRTLEHRLHDDTTPSALMELLPWEPDRNDDDYYAPSDLRFMIAGMQGVRREGIARYENIKAGRVPLWVLTATGRELDIGFWFARLERTLIPDHQGRSEYMTDEPKKCPECGAEMRDCPRWTGAIRDWVCPVCAHVEYGHEEQVR